MEASNNTEQKHDTCDPGQTQSVCWGWLEPSSVLLPYVSLKGKGSAIGRGKETFEQRVMSNEQSSSWTSQLLTRDKEDNQYKGLDFVTVADARVSRMHCVVLLQKTENGTEAILEDCSMNGTFVNGVMLGKGASVTLNDRDKVSLVMSVAPMTEKYFVYHNGCPRELDYLKFGSREDEPARQRSAQSPSNLSKWPTTKYATADQSTLDDFQCQICLDTLASCVTIEPCGHNFCAACLSKYLSNQLENGVQWLCPLRCPDPERFVKNDTVRELIEKKKRESGKPTLESNDEEVEQIIENEFMLMSSVCPLFDDQLPLEADRLKTHQVSLMLKKLTSKDAIIPDKNHCLEVLARLCWSDDIARKEFSDAFGIDIIKKTMEKSMDDEAVQCNGCLVLMSLVRGEGCVCQWNQWEIARHGLVEVIGKAMRRYQYSPMVQLSAMLCFIPLALDNPMMQAHLTQAVLPDIMRALDLHQEEADVQCKGLIVLGILAQGEDTLHDAICMRQMENGMAKKVITALERYGSSNEEVFWGALFALATMAREGSPRFNSVCRTLAQCGVLKLLVEVMDRYTKAVEENHQTADETIMAAGQYLIQVITEASRVLRHEWHMIILGGLGIGLLAGSILALVTLKKRA